MKYTNQYRDASWLYTVYGNERKDDYILIAVWPGAGWEDVAIRLRPSEVDLLRASEEAFIEFVKEVSAGRNSTPYRERRIESCIISRTIEAIEVEVDTGDHRTTRST